MKEKRIIKRYSLAFQRKVVGEIEEGKLSISEAQRLYDIKGGETIQKWIKKFGKDELLGRVVRVELKDEVNRLKELEKRTRELESALAQAHLELLCLEKMLALASREYGEDIKKKFATKV